MFVTLTGSIGSLNDIECLWIYFLGCLLNPSESSSCKRSNVFLPKTIEKAATRWGFLDRWMRPILNSTLSLNPLSPTSHICERLPARDILKSPNVSITFSRYGSSYSCIRCTGNSCSGLRRKMHRWNHKRLAKKLHNAHGQGLYRNCKHLLLCCVPRWWVFFL